MPRSAHDDIINLTDVIEEGHPERPNLQPSKSSASDSDGMLDDLDLEREIDQIFADLGPRSARNDQPSDKSDSSDPDPLDLEDLFADHETPGSAPDGQDAAEVKKNVEDDFSGFQDDFEDLFTQQPSPAQDLQAEPDLETQMTDPDKTAQEPMTSDHDISRELSLEVSEEPHETASLPPESSTDLAAEAFNDEVDEEQLKSLPGETTSGQRKDSPSKFSDDAPRTTSFSDHADSNEAVDPSMMETILRRLDELESKLAAQGPVESVPTDKDGLLEQLSGQIDSRIDASLQDVRQAGSRTLEELEQLKVEQEQRLEQVAAVLREEMANRIEEAASQLKEYLISHVETQFSQLNDRLESLQNTEEQPGDSDSDPEEREHRVMETIRNEIQALRTEWDGQRSTLAGDLENSLNYWTRLQEKFNAMQEEWSVLREAQELQASDQQPGGEGHEAIASTIEQLRTELRNELLDEIHKAVPGAAAQIIREEIQALSQEES
ncbi:hypothetical protein SAMN05660653_00660 [Desulfonatronum thiosulfatophilum]|uniref:Uncharacterized protein n=1 Tax=Desulfonatronum thiosulfatophilum TaxID=617002 RepID=A0A1G6AYF1_9BACT|nr:hypothetical protein [Desulfonatronum thiosulfatophilum]SDB13446.1 hypothetical protein SAMN05660653_00660 [Desulfonatronum thiosulfatophilum]